METEHRDSNKLIKKLRAIQRVATTLYLTEDPNEIFEKLLDAIVEVMEYDYATLSLVDRNQETIRTVYGKTRFPERISLDWMDESDYPLTYEDIVPITARNKKISIIDGWDEMLNKEIYDKYHHERLIRAFLPIYGISGEVVGVVEAGYDKTLGHKIDIEGLQDLELFTTQVGLAIQNSIKLSEVKDVLSSQARLEGLAILGNIAKNLFSALGDSKAVLQLIADSTKNIFCAHSVVILPLMMDGKFNKDLITISPQELENTYKVGIPKRHGITSQIINDGVIEIEDATDKDRYPNLLNSNFLTIHNIISFYGFRLDMLENTLGIFLINFSDSHKLLPGEISLITGITHLTSGSIRNNALIESEKKRSDDLSKLLDLSNFLSTDIDLKSYLEEISKKINEVIPNDNLTFWLLERPSEHDINKTDSFLRPIFSCGQYSSEVYRITLNIGEGIVGISAAEGQTKIVFNTKEVSGGVHVPGTLEEEDQAIIAVPLIFENDLLGVMAISRLGLGTFDKEYDLSLANLIGEIATSSIKIINLVENLKNKEKKLQSRQEVYQQQFDDAFSDRSERYAGMLFYNTVAHSIRNVLNDISAMMANLESNQDFLRRLSNSGKETFVNSRKALRLGQKTIVEFLNLAQNQTEGKSQEDVNRLVENAIKLMESRFSQNAITVEMQLNPNLPSVYVNSFRVLEVILNLISNSIKSMNFVPKGRRQLIIKTSLIGGAEKRYIELLVSDTGIGIKKENEKSLFTLNYTWWPTSDITGTGIGLHVSKWIMNKYGGDIHLMSNRYGYGATFQVVFPCAKEL